MKSIKIIVLLLMVLTGLQTNTVAQEIVQEKSYITFEVSNMKWSTVEGKLPRLVGDISFDPDNPQAGSFNVQTLPEYIHTGVGMRDNHLQKEDFFYTSSFPTISFRSNRIVKTNTGYETEGVLSIKGTSKSITIPFSVSRKNGFLALEGITEINRNNFNIGEGFGSFTIGTEVRISITCTLRQEE